MCDGFMDGWDDMDDNIFDPDNDFDEDIAGEYSSSYEEEIFEEPVDSLEVHSNEEEHFDILDAMIVGSMIAGCAYEEAEDEKRKRKVKKR